MRLQLIFPTKLFVVEVFRIRKQFLNVTLRNRLVALFIRASTRKRTILNLSSSGRVYIGENNFLQAIRMKRVLTITESKATNKRVVFEAYRALFFLF